MDLLVARRPDVFEISKLATTRRPMKEMSGNRIFMSQSQFDEASRAGKFCFEVEFDDNRYGWFADMLGAEKIQLNDVLPENMLEFLEMSDEVIPLMFRTENYKMLESRMLARGDNPEHVARRLALAKESRKYQEEVIEALGDKLKIFEIDDDSAFEDEVVPWMLNHVNQTNV